MAGDRHWCTPARHALLQSLYMDGAAKAVVTLVTRLHVASLAYLSDHQVCDLQREPSSTSQLQHHAVCALFVIIEYPDCVLGASMDLLCFTLQQSVHSRGA